MDPTAKTRFSEARPDPMVGRSFSGYRIEEVVGRGGMGTVYKATQLSLGRPVALKILSADLAADPQFLDRFHREADVLARLSHPNIVAVYDRGEVDGQPYLAMEYVEGTSLREIMRSGPLEPAEALRIVSSVLSALACAHDSGIIHRDIKPENVLLAKSSIVKVADFGLSRLLGSLDETRLTRTQLVLGTYEYMAPEQRERAREADSRADLYATGVVLYEMLTGELPIGKFDLPSHRRPRDCDVRIDALIERSLQKNPDQRWQRASEMGVAVSAILDRPAPVGPQPPPPAPRDTAPPSYQPARFEYHIDNLATINHVLGTLCYVGGALSLFGARWFELWVGLPFFVFFIAGWYMRETAEKLRKYRTAARTSQAVIAILCACTGVLLPFSIYSMWVLFSHRGRTYYEARGRGLNEVAAARHTYRLLEQPYAVAPAPPPAHRPPAPAPPLPPRPSQIPVQSMVTSEVVESRPRRRWSRLVVLGYVALLVTIGVGALTALRYIQIDDYIPGPLTATVGLLGLGLLVCAFTGRPKGAVAALVGLGILGALVPVYDHVRASTRPGWTAYSPLGGSALPAQVPTRRTYLGAYDGSLERDFEKDFFGIDRMGWLITVTGHRGVAPTLSLRRSGSRLYLDVRHPERAQSLGAWEHAAQDAVAAALGGGFRPAEIPSEPPPGFRQKLDANPPPR